MSAITDRDSRGELPYKVCLDIDIPGQVLPTMICAADWKAAAAYLTGKDFRAIADKVDTVTIHNRDCRAALPPATGRDHQLPAAERRPL